MESITEWAGKISKNNTKGKQLQEELFRRIILVLRGNINTYDECVAALCRFDSKAVVTFYEDYYWTRMPDRAKWDEAFLNWARSKKNTVSATIRMGYILQAKLKKAEGSKDVLPELRWLSLHEDDRSVPVYKGIQRNSKPDDLRKLLDLDMRDWKSGHPLINKMYGILFADDLDPKTQELYREFQVRNGLIKEDTAVPKVTEQPQLVVASEAPAETAKETVPENNSLDATPVETSVDPVHSEQVAAAPVEIPADPVHSEQASATPVEIPADSVHSEQVAAIPDENATITNKSAETPKDGIALAEAMLKWARSQTERQIELGTNLLNAKAEAERIGKQNEKMSARIDELEADLLLVRKEKVTLEGQLAEANERSKALEVEKNAAQDTIGRVQIMSGNSIKQEIDGFKQELASALSSTIKDFSDVSDLPDDQKVEIYTALMEDLLDILKHHGIVIEGN